MAENSSVQQHNKILYVEPNYTGAKYQYGSSGIEATEIAPALEDYSMYVNLEVEVKGRVLQANGTTNTKTIIMSWESGSRGDTVNFMQGTKLPIGNGKYINSFTTDYTNATITDLRQTKGSTEMFGISSIDIAYNNYMVPEVTIEFVDIRGMSVFGAKENQVTEEMSGGISDNNIAESFFQTFFTFPYPKFTLIVKGFYGQPVSYELTCADFRGKFDSSTGSFGCTAKFVGYAFSFLNDAMMNYLVAAPYSDYIGAEYWEHRNFKVKNICGSYSPMPKIGQLIGDYKNILSEAEYVSQNDPKVKERAQLDDETKFLTSIRGAYVTYYNALLKLETFYNPINAGSRGDFKTFFRDDSKYILILHGSEGKSLIDALGGDSNSNSVIKAAAEAYKVLLDLINRYNVAHTTKLPIPVSIDNLRSKRVIFKTNNAYTSDCESNSYIRVSSQIYNELAQHVEKANSSPKGNVYVVTDNTYGFFYKDNGINDSIATRMEENANRVKELDTEIDTIKDDVISSRLGFDFNVENMARVLMAHFETFAYMIYKTAMAVCSETPQRTVSSLMMGSDDISDVSSLGSDSFVPPFPKITKVVRNSSNNNIREEAWLDEFNGSGMREIDLVNGLLNGVNAIAEYVNEYNSEDQQQLTTGEDMTAQAAYPICPYDLVATQKPYHLGERHTLADIMGLMLVRGAMIMNANRCYPMENYAEVLGKAEAMNYLDCYSLSNEMCGLIGDESNGLTADDVINMAINNSSRIIRKPSGGKWPWEGKNDSNTSIFRMDGKFNLGYVTMVSGKSKQYLPMQDVTFTTLKGKPENGYSIASSDSFIAVSETYISGAEDPNGTNLFRMELVDDRIPYILEKQLTGITNIERVAQILAPKGYSDFLYDDRHIIAYAISGLDELSQVKNKSMLPSTYDSTADYSGILDEYYYNMDNIDEGFYGFERKQNGIKDYIALSGDVSQFTITNVPLPAITLDSRGNIATVERTNELVYGSVFGYKKYYDLVGLKKRACVFIYGLMAIYKNVDRIIEDYILSDSTCVQKVPLPIILYMGAALWGRSEGRTFTGYEGWMDTIRHDANRALVKIFECWAEQKEIPRELSKVRSVLMDCSFKWINDLMGLWVKVDSPVDRAAAFKNIAAHNKHGRRSMVDLLNDYFEPNLFENYVTIGEGSTSNCIVLMIRDNSIGSQLINKLALSVCTLVKNYSLLSLKNEREVIVNLGDLKRFANGFLSQIREKVTVVKSENGTYVRQVQSADISDDIKVGIYRYCKLFYDKWMGGMDDNEFNSRWTVDAFFDREDKFFHFIDVYYNYVGDWLKCNLGDFVSHIVNCQSQTQYSLLSFFGYVAQHNKFNFFCIQNFLDMSMAENLEDMFKPVPYTLMNEPSRHPSFVVIYPYEASSHLDLDNHGYSDDSFMVNDYNNMDSWPEPLKAKYYGSDTSYAIPAFGVTFGKMYQNYFKNIEVGMDNPMTTEQSIRAAFEIASQNATGEVGDKRSAGVTLGQDLYSVYSNNSYTCTVEMMGCAWVQPLMYFCLNNVPMFRGTYLVEKVTHHLEPGNMTTKFVGVRMSKYATRRVRDSFWRKKNTQSAGGQYSLQQSQWAAANTDNDCPYQVFPITNGGRGGGIPESELNKPFRDYVARYKGNDKGKINSALLNMSLGDAFCAMAGHEAGATSKGTYLGADDISTELIAACIVNRYWECGNGDTRRVVAPSQIGSRGSKATMEMANLVRDRVWPILTNGPAYLVGRTVSPKNADEGGACRIRTNGPLTENRFTKHVITMSDMQRINSYCTSYTYDPSTAKVYCPNGGCAQEKNVEKYWGRNPLFQCYGSVFIAEPNNEWWQPVIDIKGNSNQKVSELAKGFLNAVNNTSKSSSVNVEVGIDTSKSNGNTVYLTNSKSKDISKIFDIILNAYYDCVEELYWHSDGTLSNPPIGITAKVKQGAKKHQIGVKVNGKNVSFNSTGMHENFYLALKKKYKSCSNTFKTEVKGRPSDESECSAIFSEGATIKSCDTVMAKGTGNGKCKVEGIDPSKKIGDWNVGQSLTWLNESIKYCYLGYKGNCARAVKYALAVGGIEYQKGNAGECFKDYYSRKGFQSVLTCGVNAHGDPVEIPSGGWQMGDVVEWSMIKGKKASHVAITDGNGNWWSDCKQRLCGVSNPYGGTCTVWRYSGSGGYKPNATSSTLAKNALAILKSKGSV